MHAISGSWSGKPFALATSNDSGGKKSRIRRSKEERKTMVESFIKKYQISNDGSFPSLNLTHKEVGGSFYTVREIVREVIQENRVLAPPKMSPEDEHIDFEFLEQYPLGSISMEPQFESFVSDSVHIGTHVLTQKYETPSEENISSSTKQLNGSSFHLELENGQSKSHQDHYYLINNDEKIVNGIGENSHFDNRQDNNENAILSAQETDNKNEEFEERICTKSAVTEVLDEDKYEVQDVEAYETDKCHVNTNNVVVETFPLRPVLKTIHEVDEKSGDLKEEDGTLEAIQKSSGFDVATVEENITDDEKVVVNVHGLSLESYEYSPASESVVLDMDHNVDLEAEKSLPVGAKAISSTERLIFEETITVGMRSSSQDNNNSNKIKSSLPKENNPTLDRINLETWEVTWKKSTQPESNPILALVKAFISSFVKVWTE